MYLDFYSLDKEPFHITPDPEFLYLSPSHKEAFATVMYGVQKQKGFVAVTGEVGTGKTTVLRAYIEKIRSSNVRPVYLFNPDLDFDELIDVILRELGLEADAPSTATKVRRLHGFLIEEYRQKRSVVLLIDEAQNMPVETLEKLRVLSNLETTKDKLLQVVLIGQPELVEKLSLHSLRQLNQRIAVRAVIKPLKKLEGVEYIHYRIAQAGGQPEGVFTPTAVNALVKHARGNPRKLNIACDNALIAGYGGKQRPVTVKVIREVVSDLEGRKFPWLVRALAPVAAVLFVLGGVVGYLAWNFEPPVTGMAARSEETAARAERVAPAPREAAVSGESAVEPIEASAPPAVENEPVPPPVVLPPVPEPPVSEAPIPEPVAETAAENAEPVVEELPAAREEALASPVASPPENVLAEVPAAPVEAPETVQAPSEPVRLEEVASETPSELKPQEPVEVAKQAEISEPALEVETVLAAVAKPILPVLEAETVPSLIEMPGETVVPAVPPAAKPSEPAPVAPEPVVAEPAPIAPEPVVAERQPVEPVPEPAEPVAPASTEPPEAKPEEPEKVVVAKEVVAPDSQAQEPKGRPWPFGDSGNMTVASAAVPETREAPEVGAPSLAPVKQPEIPVAPVPEAPAVPAAPTAAPEAPLDLPVPVPVVKRIREGDNLWDLITAQYGGCSPALVAAVMRLNPTILDPNQIYYGDSLIFPDLESLRKGDAALNPAKDGGAAPQRKEL